MSVNPDFFTGGKRWLCIQRRTIKAGTAMLYGKVIPGADVFIPLRTLNRHGLIAGPKDFSMIR